MTYRQMFATLTEEQLDQTITVYVTDEYMPCHLEVSDDECDVLDEGHAYLKIDGEQ
jgi:hypothetical protein